MSPTGQVTSSSSDIQLIIDAALADYAKITGIDLSKSFFASMLEQSNSPEAILVLLQERQKAFKTYRDRYRRLISCLSPAVTIIHAFSGILGEAVSLVSVTYHPCESFNVALQAPFSPAKAVFTSIDVLLTVRPLNTLFNQFLCNLRPFQGSPRVMTLSLNFLNIWRISSNVLRCI